ncbi:hypothetical protein [Dolichospermum sp. UHCC 0259]|nr:hypothetical protein [Dolichospermum sp. UHCC 0259]
MTIAEQIYAMPSASAAIAKSLPEDQSDEVLTFAHHFMINNDYT